MLRDSSGRFLPRQQRQPQSQPWNAQRNEAPCRERSTLSAAGAAMGLIGGVAVGAAAMYLLDPEKGQDRREAALDAANRALETTTDAVGGAYETTTHALHDVWDRVAHKAGDLTSAAAASVPALPSARAARKSGRRLLRRASNYGSGALDTARGYLPHVHLAKDHHEGFSATTTGLTAVGALAVGLGAMWLFDPSRGRGRRAWIAQKATRVLNETGEFMRATGRHLRNKAIGYTHEAGAMLPLGGGEQENDETIGNRVRSELGRLGIAGSVGVRAETGRIILTGRCATDDVDRILVLVRGTRGVSGIDNQLNVSERFPTAGAATTNPQTSNISA